MKISHAREKEGQELSRRNVNMSNALVRAAQGLTLAEKRVMTAAIAKLDSLRTWNPEKLRAKLTALEYAETYDLDPNTAYEQLQEAAERLFLRYASWVEKKGKGDVVVKAHWCSTIRYHKNEGWVELSFHHEIAPYLFMLREKFTSYKLAQASALRSIYSWRVLELLMQYKSKGEVCITVEEFENMMDVPKSYRKNFKNLRIRVIEPAIRELKERDNLIVEWVPIRRGRRVHSLFFKFERDPQMPLITEEVLPE